MSRGALYHHFKNKEAVFTAVLETLEERVAAHVTSAASEAASPNEALRRGCGAFIALASSDHAVRQIVLTDAPVALGWNAWRAIEQRYALGLLTAAFARAAAAGQIDERDVAANAHLLLAVVIEAALLLASSADPVGTAPRTVAGVERVIDAMFAPRALPRTAAGSRRKSSGAS